VEPAAADGRIEVRPVGGGGLAPHGRPRPGDCLITVPEAQTRVEPGDLVPVVLLDGGPGGELLIRGEQRP